MSHSPLIELHKESGAVLTGAFDCTLPERYASLEEEYAAITGAAAVVDRCHIGRLKLTGQDGLDLLNRLSTNNLEELTATGQGMSTVLTTNKGRVFDLLTVVRLDDYVLVLTGPENQQKVAERIDFYTFSEDVTVHDVTDALAIIGITGPGAVASLGGIADAGFSGLAPHHASTVSVCDGEALVVRTDFAGLDGYDLVVAASQARPVWTALVDAGATPVGTAALDTVRVERRVPAFGRELTEGVNPLEANLIEAISFNKGCYVGQEVVARLNTYDKVQRRLVALSWENVDGPDPSAVLSLEGKKVGEVTSTAWSPRLKKGVGLGYVKKAQAESGTMLAVGSGEGGATARVEELPL